MNDDWIKVFDSHDLFKAKMVEDVLKQHGVESHILDKPGSAFPSIGTAGLYAPHDKAERAKELIANIDFTKP